MQEPEGDGRHTIQRCCCCGSLQAHEPLSTFSRTRSGAAGHVTTAPAYQPIHPPHHHHPPMDIHSTPTTASPSRLFTCLKNTVAMVTLFFAKTKKQIKGFFWALATQAACTSTLRLCRKTSLARRWMCLLKILGKRKEKNKTVFVVSVSFVSAGWMWDVDVSVMTSECLRRSKCERFLE